MEWINIHTATLNSPEFIGAEPVDRATWLCLLAYCCGQENGGRIAACTDWGDRRWQQLARVTAREIRRASELWNWDGADLVIRFYPTSREREIRLKREAGKQTANRRWNLPASGSADSSAISSPETIPIEKLDAEGKGREGKGRERGATPPPAADELPPSVLPDEAEVMAWAAAWPGHPAMGIPPGIPTAWVLGWLGYRTRPGAGPLGDWRRAADQAFRADWASGHPKARGKAAAASGTPSPVATRIGLESAVREAKALVKQREEALDRAATVSGPQADALRAKFGQMLREAEDGLAAAQAKLTEVAA
jgi:hypothetical protein